MREKQLSRIICNYFDSGLPVGLISIVNVQGSTPRHHGTKMVVGADGKTHGTIGGSLLEATAIEQARTALTEKQSTFLNFELTGEDVQCSGMICGGRATILVEFVPATDANKTFFNSWDEATLSGKDCYFMTGLKEYEDRVDITGHSLIFADYRTEGDCPLGTGDMSLIKEELHNISSVMTLTLSDGKVLIERMRKLKTVYCFGAGHVAVPTAYIASMVGFRVVVMDDRAEFANAERFPDADKVMVIPDFTTVMKDLDVDKDSFIVIITRGHQYDREVLEQALRTDAGYIGMISSRKKRDTIYAALKQEGVSAEQLERVHSPIGLAIGAETPEEIAVSILGELIDERDKMQKE